MLKYCAILVALGQYTEEGQARGSKMQMIITKLVELGDTDKILYSQ